VQIPLSAGPLHEQGSTNSRPTRAAVFVIVYTDAPLVRLHFEWADFVVSCEQFACAVFVVMRRT
jgi:hypothetical protein